jgi:hypothetical protein
MFYLRRLSHAAGVHRYPHLTNLRQKRARHMTNLTKYPGTNLNAGVTALTNECLVPSIGHTSNHLTKLNNKARSDTTVHVL